MTMALWLDPIPAVSRPDAIESLDAGDWLGFLVTADNVDSLHLVFRNLATLRARNIYEPALLHALTITRTNNARWSLETLRFLIDCADRDRLRAAGQPLPGRGPFTLYRGVAGRGRARRIRGLSWTTDRDIAEKFSRRFAGLFADPAVFRVVVDESDVLAYVDDRQEQEFLVLLSAAARPVRDRAI
jgi:hypothetical protein